jgi:hypothetical protein
MRAKSPFGFKTGVETVKPLSKKGYDACSVCMHDELVISLPFLQKKMFILLLKLCAIAFDHQLPFERNFSH